MSDLGPPELCAMGTTPAAMYSTTLMPKCSSTIVCSPATASPTDRCMRSGQVGSAARKGGGARAARSDGLPTEESPHLLVALVWAELDHPREPEVFGQPLQRIKPPLVLLQGRTRGIGK